MNDQHKAPETDITKHSGSKYVRQIYSCRPDSPGHCTLEVDVYSVLVAFNVTDPALAHCAKKVLCAGIRDKASRLQDLVEARDALTRAIQMEQGGFGG